MVLSIRRGLGISSVLLRADRGRLNSTIKSGLLVLGLTSIQDLLRLGVLGDKGVDGLD